MSRTNLPAQLVDQSLVITEETLDGATWYRFLETIRAYAIEKLSASGAESKLRGRTHRGSLAALGPRPCVGFSDHDVRRSRLVSDGRGWTT